MPAEAHAPAFPHLDTSSGPEVEYIEFKMRHSVHRKHRFPTLGGAAGSPIGALRSRPDVCDP